MAPLVANACNLLSVEQWICQTGLPPWHSLRYWWFPLGQRERRKKGLYCLAACWVKPAGLTGKSKGKRLLSTFFFSKFSLYAFKEWRSKLNASISCAFIKCHQGKEPQVRVCGCSMHPHWSHCSTLSGAGPQQLACVMNSPSHPRLQIVFGSISFKFVLLWVNVFWSLSHCWWIFECLEPHPLHTYEHFPAMLTRFATNPCWLEHSQSQAEQTKKEQIGMLP